MLQGGKPEAVFANRLRELTANSLKILDIGTSQRFSKELRPYESLFAGKEYVAAGYNPENIFGAYNCDCHQDIEKMTFADGSFDAVICLEVLEHVRNPFQASKEVMRVLRSGGRLLLTAPFLTSYHGRTGESQSHPHYPDFWRFTHKGLDILFEPMGKKEIIPLDGPIEFRLKQMKLDAIVRMPLVRGLVDFIDKPRLGKATSRHMLFACK